MSSSSRTGQSSSPSPTAYRQVLKTTGPEGRASDSKAQLSVAYLNELNQAIESLPKNLGDSRKADAAAKGDPLPFTTTRLPDGTQEVYFPEELNTEDKTLVMFAAVYYQLTQMAGFVAKPTSREVAPAYYSLYKNLAKTVEGSYHCMNRDEIAPQDNIPEEFRIGWNFGLWYAYVGATGDTDGGSYLRITKQTKLTAEATSAWAEGTKITDLTRFTSSLQTLCKAIGARREMSVRKVFKPKGFFLQTNGGKKPVAGLYHPEEIEIVQMNWESRMQKIADLYDQLPSKISDMGPKNNVATYVQRFNISNTEVAKKIEECKSTRIPELLVDGPKGKDRKPTKMIAKGSDLPQKLSSINGGDSVRTIGKVMYTPVVQGFTKNQFVDLVVKEVNSKLSDARFSYLSKMITKLETDKTAPSSELEKYVMVEPYVSLATSVYLEVIPDRRGNSSWDGVFPPLKR